MPATRFNGFRLDDIEAAIAHVDASWDHFRDASLFVTGGTGFLGQWLLALLLVANRKRELNLRITALTRSPRSFAAKCPDLAADPALTLLHGDARSFEFPKGRFTHLIHAATDTSVAADNQPLVLFNSIVEGTRRVMNFAHMAGIRKVVFTSSGAVYGPQPPELAGIREDYTGACATTDRRSVYGQAKRAAEQLLTIYHHEFGIETRIARCFAFVGPGMPLDAHFAIGNFIRDAVEGKQITITGDGLPVRSYLYAADAAAWLIRILDAGEAGAAYNVGSDHACTLSEIAGQVAKTINPELTVDVQGKGGGGFRSRYAPDVGKARQLGLDVWTGLDTAISRTAEWHLLRRDIAQAKQNNEVGAQEGSDKEHKVYTLVVDIDGVIASLTLDNDYSQATPLQQTIEIINSFYDRGHRIILFTARGSATGIDWSGITADQMKRWGVKYHELRFGKPAADYYIDDRLISIGELGGLAQ